MIKIENLYANYRQIEALHGLNLNIESGKITCLVGSNGAGKTTLLKSISGMVSCRGSILYEGREELVGKNSVQIARMGISHVPEGRNVFPGLTVEENLITGTVSWHGLFGRGKFDDSLEEVYTLFPRLLERRNQLSWSLSGGEQQMLAIGRALMAKPKLLMLDEPSMGLSPIVTAEVFQKIEEINRNGMTILLIEQNAKLAMKISDDTYVIVGGKNGLSGKSADLRNDPRITDAYLGKF